MIGEDIEAEDMSARVLVLYAFLEQKEGNTWKAKNTSRGQKKILKERNLRDSLAPRNKSF